MWISPSFQVTDFRQPLSISDKIAIFEDRTIGWKLDIADQVINGRKRSDGSEERSPILHSGFATLEIVFSYFEMIAKYEDGFAQKGGSRKFFELGVYSVFPELRRYQVPAEIQEVRGEVKSVINCNYSGC